MLLYGWVITNKKNDGNSGRGQGFTIGSLVQKYINTLKKNLKESRFKKNKLETSKLRNENKYKN